jgi:hypothetical protein
MDDVTRSFCTAVLKKQLRTGLGRAVDDHLRSISVSHRSLLCFDNHLTRLDADQCESADDFFKSLWSDVSSTAALLGPTSPFSLCLQTVLRDIGIGLEPVLEGRRKALQKSSLDELCADLVELSGRMPNSYQEFQDCLWAAQSQCFERSSPEPIVYDVSDSPVTECADVWAQCQSVTCDEHVAGILDIIEQYHDDIDVDDKEDVMYVDFATFNAVTLGKLRTYLKGKVSEAPEQQKPKDEEKESTASDGAPDSAEEDDEDNEDDDDEEESEESSDDDEGDDGDGAYEDDSEVV